MRRGSDGAAPASKGALQCTVRLLDGSHFQLEVNKKQSAQFTFDQILRRLSIVEKDYFALEYEDEQKNTQWVDLQKPLKKQVKKIPMKVNFRVKYYPLDPMIPHISCRNHFYQQLRRDIIDGVLKCPTQTAPAIISCILQADLGDFESTDKDVEFLTDNRLLMGESAEIHKEIASFHQLYRGMNAPEAVSGFLRKVRELDTYGIQLYDMRYEDSSCQLGISPGGVSIFRRNRRILFQDWSNVAEVSFKNRKLLIVLVGMATSETVLTLEMESLKVCKDVWKICAERASFYSEPGRRVKEDPVPDTVCSPGARQHPGTFSLPQSSSSGQLAQTSFSPHHQPSSSAQPQPSFSPHHQASIENGDPNWSSAQPQPTASPHHQANGGPNWSTAQQKARSLPHKLPNDDPITAALIEHRRDGRNFGDTPTSPEDFTSLSASSISDGRNMSPLTPLSPGQESTEMDIILPGMPNLRDEYGQPLNPPQPRTTPPQQKTTPPQLEKVYQYKEYRDFVKESPSMERSNREGRNGLRHVNSDVSIESGHRQRSFSDLPSNPPILPPRNYNSQYRSDFHARHPQRSHQGHSDHGSSNNSRTNSRTNLSQDMDGSLLDLADELGDGGRDSSTSLPSSSSGGRRGHADVGGALGVQRGIQNGNHSPRGEYNSHTLPSSHRKRHSNETTPPDQSPRHTEFHTNGSSPMPGSSPYLPGSALTTGRDHKQKDKSGRSVVRNWVQEQQLRTYHSSPSQHSLDSASSQERSSSSRSQHHQQQQQHHQQHLQPSPDMRSSSQHSQGSYLQSSPPELKRSQHSQGSSRSSSSLPRGQLSSGSLRNERDLEQERLKSMSLENKGMSLLMSPQEFATKGGSRVYHQFKEALLADDQITPYEGHQQRAHVHSRSHDPYHRSHDQQQAFDHRQRSHEQHQRSYSDHYQRSHDQHQRSYDQHQRSHDQYQRSHDQHQRSHDQYQQQRWYDSQRSHEEQQRSHDHRQRSHDPVPEHFKYTQPPVPMPQQVAETSDYPLPDSPAPPPYKSPSPDSEQAQVLQQLGRQPRRQLKKQKFTYHAGALGMGPEPTWTDLSQVDDDSRRAAKERVHSKRSPTGHEARLLADPPMESAVRPLADQAVSISHPPQHQPRVEGIEVRGAPRYEGRGRECEPITERCEDTGDGHTDRGVAMGGIKEGGMAEQVEPDFMKELDELMGGVEAMMSEAAALDGGDSNSLDRDKDTVSDNQDNFCASTERSKVNEASEFVTTDLPIRVDKNRNKVCFEAVDDFDSGVPGSLLAIRESGSRADEEIAITVSSPVASPAKGGSGPGGVSTEEPRFSSDEHPTTESHAPRLAGFTEEDNLADILQEVMESDNLPPPPAHLMALSQELEFHSQDTKEDIDEDDPHHPNIPPKKLSSIATTSHHTHQEPRPPKKDARQPPLPTTKGAKFDAKLFSHKKVELPLPYNTPHVTKGTSHLPPEIANFMNRVRNLSNDGSDSHVESKATNNPNAASGGDNAEDKDDEDIPVARKEDDVITSDVIAGASNPKPLALAQGDHNMPSSGQIADEGATAIIEPSSGCRIADRSAGDAAVWQEAASNPARDPDTSGPVSAHRETERGLDSVPEPTTTEDDHPLLDPTSGQYQKKLLPIGQRGSESEHRGAGISPRPHTTNDLPVRSDDQEPRQQVSQLPLAVGATQRPVSANSRSKAFSLPRGHMSDYRRYQNETASSRGSTPTTPHAHSDLVAPVYPQHVHGQERGRGHREQQQQWALEGKQGGVRGAKGNDEGVRKVKDQQQDMRRTHTFPGNTTHHQRDQAEAPPQRPSISGADSDSIPTSPTQFAHLQQEEAHATPSPATQVANRSFQEHLDSLDEQTKMRKKKVMDWIQRSNTEAWEKENTKKEEEDPRKLQLDPGAVMPTRPYQKQLPIYATVDDPDAEVQQEVISHEEPVGRQEPVSRVRHHTSGSVPNQNYPPPQWRSGTNTQQYGMESRQRAVTVSGTRLEPVSGASHHHNRHYPPPARPNVGVAHGQGGWGVRAQQGTWNVGVSQGRGVREIRGAGAQQNIRGVGVAQGRGGRGVQGPNVQQSIDPSTYPTKFGKDYYVLDV